MTENLERDQGRDRSYTPRIRIPSMEVSKHHACISVFPDGRFGISDTGSTHGEKGRPRSERRRISLSHYFTFPFSLFSALSSDT